MLFVKVRLKILEQVFHKLISRRSFNKLANYKFNPGNMYCIPE